MSSNHIRKGGAKQYTFAPDPLNRQWLDHQAAKNRRSVAAELNVLVEQARQADKTFVPQQEVA